MTNTVLEESYQPYIAPTPAAVNKEIVLLPWSSPFTWLRLGWRDLTAHPLTRSPAHQSFLWLAFLEHGTCTGRSVSVRT
jgi:hypothetical protein